MDKPIDVLHITVLYCLLLRYQMDDSGMHKEETSVPVSTSFFFVLVKYSLLRIKTLPLVYLSLCRNQQRQITLAAVFTEQQSNKWLQVKFGIISAL